MGEFADVVRRRRMTRAFEPDPIPSRTARTVSSISPRARRAPARRRAGTWSCSRASRRRGSGTSRCPPMRRGTFKWQRLLDAPVIAAAVRRRQGVRRSLLRARQGGHRPRRRRRGVAGAVLDDRHLDGGDDAAAGRRGRRARGAVLRRVQGRARAAPDARRPAGLDLLGAIALGYPADDAKSRGLRHAAPDARPAARARSSTAAVGEPSGSGRAQ